MSQVSSWIPYLSLAFVLGCAGQTSNVQPSGFLKDYSNLEERKDTPRLYYVHPTADFDKYPKLMFDPVTIWAKEGNDLLNVPREDLDRLCSLLYVPLIKEIEARGKRTIVTSPGPGVMRVRIAITEASVGSKMNVVASLLPQAVFVTEGISMATGTRAFVGTASIEAMVTDSLTNELLAAGVDRRQGGRDFRSSWSHVEDHLKLWAEAMGNDFGGVLRR